MRETLENPYILAGQKIKEVEEGNDVRIDLEDGRRLWFYHDQDCCEWVRLYRTVGDAQSLVGKVVKATAFYHDEQELSEGDSYNDSHTWTTLDIEATDGTKVSFQWLGESNGYYSESIYISIE